MLLTVHCCLFPIGYDSRFDVVTVSPSYTVHGVVSAIYDVEIQIPGGCGKTGPPFEGIPSRSDGRTNRVVPNTSQGIQIGDLGSMFAGVIGGV